MQIAYHFWGYVEQVSKVVGFGKVPYLSCVVSFIGSDASYPLTERAAAWQVFGFSGLAQVWGLMMGYHICTIIIDTPWTIYAA